MNIAILYFEYFFLKLIGNIYFGRFARYKVLKLKFVRLLKKCPIGQNKGKLLEKYFQKTLDIEFYLNDLIIVH